jgi:hypothetical protein
MTVVTILAMLVGAVIAALMVYGRWLEWRGDLPAPAAPPAPERPLPLPAPLRAELDETPSWWTERFHQLLAAVSAPSVVEDVYEIVSYSGDTVLAWESRGYRDCPCHSCRRICQ